MLWIAMVLAGCGKSVEGQCNRVLVRLCDHEVECGMTSGFNSCMEQKKELYICDYDKTVADYDTCIQDVLSSNCRVAFPNSCGNVLCDKETGCIFVPHCDPEEDTGCAETTTHSGTTATCATGDTGCTQTTTTTP